MVIIGNLSDLAELLAGGRRIYLRYSAGPEADRDGTSRDYESGLPLPGLAALDLHPPDWWTRPTTDWLARQICKYGHLAEDDPEQKGWLLTGREVGRGPDNEPLVADPFPLGCLSSSVLAEARERYHERFEVGRTR
jgi:hypothetical protein